MRCNGQFSENEYESLGRTKLELQEKVRSAQSRVSERAQWYTSEMAHLATQQAAGMALEQRSLAFIQRQLDNLSRIQSDMVLRHSLVLDELDAEDDYEPDEVEISGIPKDDALPSFGAQPYGESFAFDDDELSQLIAQEWARESGWGSVGETHQGTPRVCVWLVPKCFLNHRILTF